ncbi:MAG: hypothetical protein EPO26_17215 [Chloroflexota bacterium]|nr:MAG: hypothetical protein EPO26_17215 [Chloroflexota bacterium]
MDLGDRLEVDFIVLADRAEAINGKLYMMGGAWDRLGVGDFRQPIMFSIALAVLVPWSMTNQSHKMAITMRDADGNPIDFRIEASFVTGRPPQLNGETQRVLLTMPAATVVLPGPGAFVVVVSINGQEMRSVRFAATRAVPNPAPPAA